MTDNHAVLTFIEGAEEEGVDERALVSVATELELDEDDLAGVRAELDARGIEIVLVRRGDRRRRARARPAGG